MNEWNNVPVNKIGLSKWAEEHQLEKGDTFLYKGVSHMITGERYNWADNRDTLNSTQLAHADGTFNIYEPVEAYKVAWFHKKDVYYPIDGSKKREDLPPVYIQWKDAYRKKKHARSRRRTATSV